ncbi:OBP3-responsive protein [Quillaja saponaria]|uniref:OBP3-responsive protein n=1 Tax=Quillaja saponaria TaxID=32244 RepID=A0AAD7QE64_QUISA|nr:OBP3-responsive protein [Quillaja saponaria]
MDSASNGEESTSWDELYNINLMPSELFLKFRREIQGLRVGINLEFYNAPAMMQFGIGHNFQLSATGWKWKLTTCLGGDGISQIRNKTSFGLFPGFDLRFGWRADYVLPEITGALGTGEQMFNMNSGRLQASLDRVEAVVTQSEVI